MTLKQVSPSAFTLSRRDMLKFIGLGLAAPGVFAGCGSYSNGTNYNSTIADASVAIKNALSATGTPSASVALVDRNHLIWSEAFGLIDKAGNVGTTATTLFNIGSCSKVFAATAVMILVERGKLELDAPVVNYLPSFTMLTPEFSLVTVRMLISHSSGFPGCDSRNQGGQRPFPAYAEQVMETLAHSRLKHLPGEMSVYCNDGFTMVEPLVEAVSGKSYTRFVSDEILTPLDMTLSRFALDFYPEGSFAPGYSGDIKLGQEFMNAYASGGLSSTPTEMGNFMMMMLNNGVFRGRRILQASSIREMGANQSINEILRPVDTDFFGLGWDGVSEAGLNAVGVTAWHKSGGTNIYSSQFIVLPEEGLGVMITGTSASYGALALCERILLNALVERGRLNVFPAVKQPVKLPEVQPSNDQLADMAGIYAQNFPAAIVRITQESQALAKSVWIFDENSTEWKWSIPVTLTLRNDGTFRNDDNLVTGYRSAVVQGIRYLVVQCAGAVFGSGLKHSVIEYPAMQKLEKRSEVTAAWQNRSGLTGLLVNCPQDSSNMTGIPLTRLLLNAPADSGFSGYIVGYDGVPLDASSSDSVAKMCLKIPVINGRDLNDIEIISRDDGELIRIGTFMFRAAASVQGLTAGTNKVSIGFEGYAEWRRLETPGTLTISGASAWNVYDKDYVLLQSGSGSSGSIDNPSVKYLIVWGTANDIISVDVN